MLDGCPKSLSCGSAGSIWSNHRTDIKIGDVTPIKAYTRYGGKCRPTCDVHLSTMVHATMENKNTLLNTLS